VRRAARAPHVLVAAGLEGTGRVGLLADVEAVRAAGGVATAVVTALTVQGRRFASLPVPRQLLAAELDAALGLASPRAVKLGMVPDARALSTLWPRLVRLGVPLVVDPLTATSRGEVLSRLGPRDFRQRAGPSVWLTPNVPELAWLLGRREVPRSVDEVLELATALLGDGFAAVVVKGGHLVGPPVDVLVSRHQVLRFTGRRLSRSSGQRGTGCRFSSTLATRLALGGTAASAVADARSAVRAYLRAGSGRTVVG
jgi:hydroxymethylpyrimidine/phosphomethylpyrimidine kinase